MEELAIAYWRLNKWVYEVDVEHKMAANSALRKIKKHLEDNGVEIVDYCGQQYDGGLAIDIIGRKSGEELQEEELVIVETIQPIVIINGEIKKYGQAYLGLPNTINNNEGNERTAIKTKTLLRNIKAYLEANKSDRVTSWLLNVCASRLEKQQDKKGR